MDRKEVCAKIRELNLQEAVKQNYGDNYTRVSTDKLESLIKTYLNTGEQKDKPACKQEESKTEANNTVKDNPFEAACLVFLGLLKDAGVLDKLIAEL